MSKNNGVSIKMEVKEKKKNKKWDKTKKAFSLLGKILFAFYKLCLYLAFFACLFYDAFVTAAFILIILIHIEVLKNQSYLEKISKNQKILNAGHHVLAANQQSLLNKINEKSCSCPDKKTVKKPVKKAAKKTTKKKAVKKK